ncbi:hypothetical protein NXW27_25870 [Phocaeicola dorei]|nr:hypothetical protein [Phocaeicola dorei]
MNKKFLSAILFGALMVSSTGTFVFLKKEGGGRGSQNNILLCFFGLQGWLPDRGGSDG